MVNYTKKLITLLLLFAAMHTNAQQTQILQASLQHYSTDDGLPSNAIGDIKQDGFGYIWFATWNGLSRFDGYHFYNYDTGPGSGVDLLHNRISEMAIDKQNNVWMKMYDSRVFVLNRQTDKIQNAFEGITGFEDFKTFCPITITSSGDVFVIVEGIGIYKLKLKEDNTISSELITTGKLKVRGIVEGYKNDLWVSTNNGIHRMSVSNGNVEQDGIFNGEDISSIYSNGFNIFAGTSTGKVLTFAYGQPPKQVYQDEEPITSIFVDSHNIVWFTANRNGVSRLNIETGERKDFNQVVPAPEPDVLGAIWSEVNGTLWIKMNHGGFGYYNRDTDEIEYFHNDPANSWNISNTLDAYYVVPEGVVWETTTRRGIEKLELLKNTISRTLVIDNPQSPNDNEIRALFYDEQERMMMVGNKKSQLILIKDGQKTIITGDGTNSFGRIYGISKDSSGNYWICTKGNGLFRMTPNGDGTFAFRHYWHKPDDKATLNHNNVYKVIEDDNGNLWVATFMGGVNLMIKQKDGLFKIMNKDNGIPNYPINAFHKVRAIAKDKDGRIWAGTTDGLLIMEYENEQVSVKPVLGTAFTQNSLRSNDIVSLACDPQGTMWIGTNGGGLSHFTGIDEQGNWTFDTFEGKDGLPSEEVKSITFDKRGNVWFATEHVICSFDTQKKILSTFSMLDGVDNTLCSEGAALTLPNGKILFGTLNGYYTVDLDQLVTPSASMMKLKITDFFIDDVLVSPRHDQLYGNYIPDSKEVTLPRSNSVFGFRFAALNYQLQHRIHYQYMLEGYDKDWKNADKTRTATYANLPAGTYTFKVKAFLLESPEKSDMRTIEVTVPPHFLLSASALWIYALILIIIGCAYYMWNKKRKQQYKNLHVVKMDADDMAIKHEDDFNFVKNQMDWLEQNYTNPNLKIEDLIANSKLDRTAYTNQLKALTGFTPKELIEDFRIKKAIIYLETSNKPVAEITQTCGFTDSMYFTTLFKEKTGMTPNNYREAKKTEG